MARRLTFIDDVLALGERKRVEGSGPERVGPNDGRPTTNDERRTAPRVPPDCTPWPRDARLRPGQDVVLLNVSRGGALVESGNRMTPGVRTELQLLGALRRIIRGRIERCHVSALEPLRYRGAIVFEERLDWRDEYGG